MEAIIYNTKGKEAGKISLNEKVWGLTWNADLIHQVVASLRANARTETARVKDRSEVSGGGKKPWRQKGTGRARHGSSRSPIWRHGGITHGPRPEKDYTKKVNKKMAAKALYVVLSEKLRKHEIMFVDEVSFTQPKTREAKTVLGALAGVKGYEKMLTKKRNAAYLTTNEKAPVVAKSFANFGNIDVDMIQNMNIIDLLSHKFAVITAPESSVKFIEGKIK